MERLCYATFAKVLQKAMRFDYRGQRELTELLLGYFIDDTNIDIDPKMSSNLFNQKTNLHTSIQRRIHEKDGKDKVKIYFNENVIPEIDSDFKEDILETLNILTQNDRSISKKKRNFFDEINKNSEFKDVLFEIFYYAIKRDNVKNQDIIFQNSYGLSFRNVKGMKPAYYFTGREKDIRKIEKFNVNIVGVGGIGKSEIARKVIQNSHFQYVYWFDSNKLSDNLLDKVIAVDSSFNFFSRSKKLEIIITYLSSLSDNSLIVFDDIARDAKELVWITELNCPFLITSREFMDCVENVEIDVLSFSECVDLMKKISKRDSKDDEVNLERIVMLSGRHTLVVDFLSKILRNSTMTTGEFVIYLEKINFDLSFMQQNIQYKYKNEVLDLMIAEHLVKIFSINKMSEKEIFYLSNISLLPTMEFDIDLIANICTDSKNISNKLIMKGWLVSHGEKTIYLHDIIRRAILIQAKQMEIIDSCVDYMIKSLYDKIQYSQEKKEKELLIYSVVSNSVCSFIDKKLVSEQIILFLRRLAELEYRLGNHKKSVDIQMEAIKYQSADSVRIKSKMKKELAFYLKNIGMYERASTILAESINDLKSISDKVEDSDLAEALGDFAFLMKLRGDLDTALKYQINCLQISKKVLEENDVNLGYAYGKYATILQDIGGKQNLRKALVNRKRANKILGNNSKESSDYAYGLNNEALIYLALDDLRNAMKSQLYSLRLLKKNLPKDHPDLGISYANLALICIKQSRAFWANLFIDEAYRIYSNNYDAKNMVWAKMYSILAECRFINNDLETAIYFCDMCIDVYRENKIIKHHSLEEVKKLRNKIILKYDK